MKDVTIMTSQEIKKVKNFISNYNKIMNDNFESGDRSWIIVLEAINQISNEIHFLCPFYKNKRVLKN